MSYRKATILLTLIVWFWVWGICPWDVSSEAAHAGQTAHMAHGHQEADDTHHASKGSEHSCAGAGVYNSSEDLLKTGWHQFHALFSPDLTLEANPIVRPLQANGFLSSLLERAVLPKLLSDYYRLYSVYRI
ncbi:MAG: hypothetical protein EPO39_10595 [Candidatus Manganitrophaceae bacterium]|nr:MAG: hypothetical protein EPO39_10595 [Candidatus Manganitrophaceae bacterium]